MHATSLVLALASLAVPVAAFSSSVSPAAASNFDRVRSSLPADLDVVAAGGWNQLTSLAENPKAALIDLIADTRSSDDSKRDEKLNALVALLQAQGKGFEADLIDGEWTAVLGRNSKKSPRIQRLVGKLLRRGKKAESSSTDSATLKTSRSFANFDIGSMTFKNLATTPRGNGLLDATVAYRPQSAAFETAPRGGIVLRRIGCDIVGAGFKYGRLPRIPLPIRAKGGYLDVLYLDEDMRITRGNRGGLFVHFRPDFAEEVLA